MFDPFRAEAISETFAAQFELDGTHYLYRKNSRGAAIRVSKAERDAFLADYVLRLRWLCWIMLALILLMSVGLAFGGVDTDAPTGALMLYGGVATIVLLLTAAIFWLWAAPARALETRASSGAALSPDEARRRHFARLSYGQMALSLLFIPALLLQVWDGPGTFDGWGSLWLVFAGGYFRAGRRPSVSEIPFRKTMNPYSNGTRGAVSGGYSPAARGSG